MIFNRRQPASALPLLHLISFIRSGESSDFDMTAKAVLDSKALQKFRALLTWPTSERSFCTDVPQVQPEVNHNTEGYLREGGMWEKNVPKNRFLYAKYHLFLRMKYVYSVDQILFALRG